MKTKSHQVYKTEDGQVQPGVTSVIGQLAKPALVPWAVKLTKNGQDYKKVTQEAAEIGSLGHEMCVNYLSKVETKNEDYSKNQIDKAENSYLSFLKWLDDRQYELIHVEKQMVSEKHRYGGTLDIYWKLDGVLEICDLKTGSGIYEEVLYQLAALKQLAEENGFQVDRVRALNIPRTEDDSFMEKVYSPNEVTVGLEIFLHLLQVYKLRKQKEG